jgi:hypothetical protein
MVYNILNCKGWETAGDAVGWFNIGGACMKARIGLVFLFFLIAIIRKWGGEEIGIEFNFLFALILSFLPYLLIVFLFGSFKFAMIIGLVGALVGGYGAGMFFGGGE